MKRKWSLGVLSVVLIMLLTAAPVSVAAAYLISDTAQNLENTARQTVDFYISQFTSRTESVMLALRDDIFILSTDPEIQRAMQAPLRGGGVATGAEQNVGRVLSAAGWGLNCVTGIFIMQTETLGISVLREGIYSGGARRAQAVYREYGGTNSARSLRASAECPGYLYMVVDYLNINTMTKLGKIVIELDAAVLMDDSYLDALYPGVLVVLRDKEDALLYGEPAFPLAGGGDFVAAEEGGYYHLGSRLGYYNLKVDVFVPEGEVFSSITATVRLYVVFTLAVLVLALVAGMVVFALATRPLRQMIPAIDAVAAGDFSARMPPTPYRETERIGTAFNSMTSDLQRLFAEVYQSGLHLREAEYKMLESQINPHFIFNVLEVINVRAMAAGQTDICRMVTNLAKLLRSNIQSRDRQTLTFGQELEYVRYYLELQKERFEDALCYSIELEDETLLGLYLPKLTIQPLVENSIVHGLEPKRGGGWVRVEIWEEAQGVFVRVADNGVGFDAGALDLSAEDPGASAAHNHVALYNINRRIQLLYGQDYGLTVESSPAGSVVTVRLPADAGEKEAGHAESLDRG